MDAPFALRGYLAATDSGSRSVDGLRRQPSSLEQFRGHKTGTGFPYSFSRRHQQSTPPSVGRSLHGSRVVSASEKGAFANRPLSPHLALKKPQLSATYSISHRIFGAAVASLILATPALVKFSVMFDV